MLENYIEYLNNCTCCPRCCGVNRVMGETGYCGIDSKVQISYAGLHHGEEPPISGSSGSGTIFFVGCNLRCVFCQNYQISQEFNQHTIQYLTLAQLADTMMHLQSMGAHNINFVSPSHMVYQMADAISLARDRGLTIPIVYNSNGYDSIQVLRNINGLVDIYMPDIKYMDNEMAQKYSDARNYANMVPDVLKEMYEQVGNLTIDNNGVASKGLLVRHLVLPNHMENSKLCLDVLKNISLEMYISLMSQYSPQYKAYDYPLISRKLGRKEYKEVMDYALDLGLSHVFIQELYSQDSYLPRFDREKPFEE